VEGSRREQGVGHSFRRMRGVAVDRRTFQKVDSFVFVLLYWRSHFGHTDLRHIKCDISRIQLRFKLFETLPASVLSHLLW